ncbi:MAG TPA: WecB/TagA/CpsF family glycosyltransferase [Pseudacidobacterium sp.]|nr:WecB/TagA/CpsF family glycosyltransferase [Pseudacidobacterium sp.]
MSTVEILHEPSEISRTEVVNVLGIPITNVTLDEAISRVAVFLSEPYLHHIVVVNTNKFWLADHHPGLGRIIRNAEMVITEYGPVWASRILGTPLKANVRGIGLFRSLLPWLQEWREPVYFFGARQEVLNRMLQQVSACYPHLQIAGARNGFFQSHEEDSIISSINQSGASVLFVAMGSPRQELFIENHREELAPRVAMGVGGSFDVLAGLKRDAPSWTHHGMEWIYRLWQDPRNLLGRYARVHSWFVYHTLHEKLAHSYGHRTTLHPGGHH